MKSKRKVTHEHDGWEPRINRKRGTYCSPRCGYGCTIADHDQAVVDAEKLAKRLGKGWEPHVWENLGWHFRVIKGAYTVREIVNGEPGHRHFDGYTVAFSSGNIHLNAEGMTPEIALAAVAADAQDIKLKLTKDIANV